MRSASSAEWIISRCTSKGRASAMVGDLLELVPEKGVAWFWLATIQIVLSLVWRSSLGYVAAFFAGLRALGALQLPIYGMHWQHRPPVSWQPVFGWLGSIGIISWMVLPYAAIRFGVRDRVTQLTFATTCLITATIYLWWVKPILIVCIIFGVLLALCFSLAPECQRATVVVAGTFATGLGALLLAMYLVTLYQRLLIPGPAGSAELRAHPSVQWVFGLVYGLMVLSVTSVCSRMHAPFLEGQLFRFGPKPQIH